MTGGEPDLVSGSVFGSTAGMHLAFALPLLCVSVPLAATGTWSWAAPVALVLASVVVSSWIRRNCTCAVSDEGVTLLHFGRLGFVPWSAVDSVRHGWFPSLELSEPQKVGRRRVGRVHFAGLDPHWRTRPTTVAIEREFGRYRHVPDGQ